MSLQLLRFRRSPIFSLTAKSGPRSGAPLVVCALFHSSDSLCPGHLRHFSFFRTRRRHQSIAAHRDGKLANLQQLGHEIYLHMVVGRSIRSFGSLHALRIGLLPSAHTSATRRMVAILHLDRDALLDWVRRIRVLPLLMWSGLCIEFERSELGR